MRSRIRRGDHRYKINLPAPPSRLPPRRHPLATAVASCCLLILLLLLLLVPFLRSLSHPFSIPPDYRIACAITLLACSTVVHCTSAVSRGPHHEYSRRLSCEKMKQKLSISAKTKSARCSLRDHKFYLFVFFLFFSLFCYFFFTGTSVDGIETLCSPPGFLIRSLIVL